MSPLKGVTYRVTRRGGEKVRLAFDKNGAVVEAKSLTSGRVHTPAEFKADAKRRAAKRKAAKR